ncbi:MAG: LamG-like jellyroll fold domain-containing protein [Chitinophagales bacterium]|nr:T9SS type A sorting domain-containing protein [Bacteroidota bacterium]MCB9043976.1 T9SS type A sorting domain-containing protein [Chitinophagales bacterium]
MKSVLFFSFLLGNILFLQAQHAQYLHFDRQNDYVLAENATQYIVNANAISMTGWFKTDQLAYGQGMMGFRGEQGFYIIQLSDGVLECRLLNSGGALFQYVASANTVVPNEWQHYAWVYDGSSVKLYLNGNLLGSANATGTITDDSIDFAIGRNLLPGNNFYYGGGVDEVSFWRKGLTQAEIQNLMMNEPQGNEEDLVLYYGFNQGLPGGDNTSITSLKCAVGDGERDAQLLNFSLMGETSNFLGTLAENAQVISFPEVAPQLLSNSAITLNATSSSGLAVSYTVLSGPATVSGNILTLNGNAGTVVVEASQSGNANFNPAEPITITIPVLDPQTTVPSIDFLSPYEDAQIYYLNDLSAIFLEMRSEIAYESLFSVEKVLFEIDGVAYEAHARGNGLFSMWWTPSHNGLFNLTVTAYNNYGGSGTKSLLLVAAANSSETKDVRAIDKALLNLDINAYETEAELPVFTGAFSQIEATLTIDCPEGEACDEWDRVVKIFAEDNQGEWFEIIRYVTPYGTACQSNIDLTDFATILHGKTKFKIDYVTYGSGYEFSLDLHYQKGDAPYKYAEVVPLWNATYPFGDYANLQPVESLNIPVPAAAQAATLKLVSTGHGWGENNTLNAAEFNENTHHIWVNETQAFTQNNWLDCNPNPDGCNPQAGTWYYDRAGWCPGAIAPWFTFNATPYLGGSEMSLRYVFDESYVDFCHPNYPDCVTGVTCPNCNDGFNPHLIVSSSLVFYSNSIMENNNIVGISVVENKNLAIYPNPVQAKLFFALSNDFTVERIEVYDMSGKKILAQAASSNNFINIEELPQGVYFLRLRNNDKGSILQKFVKM